MNEILTDQALDYLENTLGLSLEAKPWPEAMLLPLFLSQAATYQQARHRDIEFILASVQSDAGLAGVKRLIHQLERHTNLPIVVASPLLNARQRKALAQQGIPFIAPFKAAYLPFLAFSAQRTAEPQGPSERFSPQTQAAFVTILAQPSIGTFHELRERTALSASAVSRALADLHARSLITRWKDGRSVCFSLSGTPTEALERALPCLISPVQQRIIVRKTPFLEALPDAGETALAARTQLNPPRITQKAARLSELVLAKLDEVMDGELPDSEVALVQGWKYDPLIAGLDRIDDASLAASFAEEIDERVLGELDRLFGKEGLWSQANSMD